MRNDRIEADAGCVRHSTGAGEFAGHYAQGHCDLPVRGTTIRPDTAAVVRDNRLADAG